MRQIGTFELVTPPEAEPVTLAAAKLHCRAEASSEDSLFETLITAARKYVEKDTGLALVNQTWRAIYDAWDERGLRLRPHPIAELVSVEVWTGAGFTAQTLGNYQLLAGRPAQVIPIDGVAAALPLRSRQGIRLTYTAGYGDDGDDVPEDLQTAMKQLIAHWYENREPTAVSESLSVVGDIKFTVGALLSNYRSLRLV